MQHRAGIWQEREEKSHVYPAWLKQLVLFLCRHRHVHVASRIINNNTIQREIYILLMGKPCSPQKLHRQVVILLLVVMLLVLVLSMIG